MDFVKYVEDKKVEARRKNLREVQEQVKEEWVQQKIDNYLKSNPGLFTKEEIENNIQQNPIVASFFCKDPSKQNISENLCAEVLNISKLPANDKNCIRFCDDGKITSLVAGNTKSADFIYNGYYATQKYTMSKGGSQDNQRNDVIDFLKRGSISHKVMAILDGAYWDEYRNELKQLFAGNDNVLITSVSELTGS